MTATSRLAGFAAGTAASAVPGAALVAARAALTDTLGVMIAGSAEPVSNIADRSIHASDPGPGGCTLVGRDHCATPAEAAFVNGIAAHALDFDDSLTTSRSHPSASVVPAMLAAAETSRASMHDSLVALTVGIEVTGRLGRLLGAGHYLKGWHSTATIGGFAAAATAARLHCMTASELATAWGIIASCSGGLVRNFGTMTKPFHAGNAARMGVDAVALVRAGFTADAAILDGPDGFLALYAGEDALPHETALDRLGETWDILDPGLCVKRWPCCYGNHRSIGGLLELIAEHGITAGEVETVHVGFPPEADRALIKTLPVTGLEAKFSIEFCMAATLLYGSPVVATFSDEVPRRTEVKALMEKVRSYTIPDKGVFSGISGYNVLRVETGRGSFETRIDRVPGSADWPVTDAERRKKFIGCSEVVLEPEASKSLLSRLEHFDAEPLEGLLHLTRPAARAMPRPTQKSEATVERKLS